MQQRCDPVHCISIPSLVHPGTPSHCFLPPSFPKHGNPTCLALQILSLSCEGYASTLHCAQTEWDVRLQPLIIYPFLPGPPPFEILLLRLLLLWTRSLHRGLCVWEEHRSMGPRMPRFPSRPCLPISLVTNANRTTPLPSFLSL